VTQPYFTIGHSNRSLDEFRALLLGSAVTHVVDVRTVPRSRAIPQFNKETLPAALAESGVTYEHVAALGGLRGKAKDVPADVNGFWTNESFHNYADYALSERFRTGLEHLIDVGARQRSAIMCSEAVWWRCHRRIIADYLIVAGATVLHIMGSGRAETARVTAGAVPRPDGTVVYPG